MLCCAEFCLLIDPCCCDACASSSSLGYAGLYTLGSMSGLTHLNLVALGELHEFNLMSELTSGLSHLTGLRVLDLRENPSLSLTALAQLKSLTALEHLGLGRYFTHALDMGTMHSRDVSKDSFYKVLLDKVRTRTTVSVIWGNIGRPLCLLAHT